ncbi:hypothetical protein KYK29_18995 [Shinella daejeonensis]|uniref:hypothetical protein n=1 Tax=Shinella daejeonensis TaxID=659017 RepID=UPI0020C77140|nr:hypothetical protein [Shinella daejeonensis]MCP8897019.1 hypothetical protein [Shinella daejeonensis]
MDDVKAWYRSRTVWGALIAIFASAAHAFGLDMSAAEQGQLADLLVALAGAAGGLVALVGHLLARRRGRQP